MTSTPALGLMGVGVVRRALAQGWTVRAAAGPVPEHLASALTGVAAVAASVPGVVHLDLLSAGLIPDPYLDVNEALLAWIGLVDWTYETTLPISCAELAAAEHHELVFDGIDTVATVLLNGTVLAEVGNQHRGHRLDVTGILREGGNELEVRFRSPIRYANAQSLEYGPRPRPYPMPFEAIRKAACSFGWDWGPATFTSGIWRPVRLESWSTARLDDVRVHAEPTGAGALGRRHRPRHPHVGCRPRPHARRRRSLGVGNDPCGETSATASVDLVAVESWWPAGHGDPTLYDVAVSLVSGGEVVDSVTRRVGFRTLRWDTTPDAGGTPSSSSSTTARSTSRASTGSRTTRSRCAWTGPATRTGWPRPGRRTSTSCASGAEARQNVARLAHHASLALFTGNNENLWGHEDWGWKERLEGRTWGAHYYHELLPAVVAEIAPHVPYAPGSPFSPGGQHPNDAGHGTTHLWEQWNSRDWPTYREVRPRFVAEFGWQGPPAWSTLTSAISDDPLAPESPGMIAHQKAVDGNAKLVSGLLRHYRVPDDMETWHWAMQLNQANAVTCALEWFRSLALHNAGAVVWQLNDCWPVTSWAAIDGDGRENPLYFALQNAFAPRVVTIQPSDGGLVVVLGNDCDEPWAGDVVLTRHAFDGSVIVAATIAASVPARSSVTVDVPDSVAEASDPASEVLVVEALGLRRPLVLLRAPRQRAARGADHRLGHGGACRLRRHGRGHRARPDDPRRQGRPEVIGRPGSGHAAAGGVGHVPGDRYRNPGRGRGGRARHPAVWERADEPDVIRGPGSGITVVQDRLATFGVPAPLSPRGWPSSRAPPAGASGRGARTPSTAAAAGARPTAPRRARRAPGRAGGRSC
jgi:beta-mannosidase